MRPAMANIIASARTPKASRRVVGSNDQEPNARSSTERET